MLESLERAEPVRRPARRHPPLVPLPPPVRRRAARPTCLDERPGEVAELHRAGQRLVRRGRRTRRRRSGTPWRPATSTGRPTSCRAGHPGPAATAPGGTIAAGSTPSRRRGACTAGARDRLHRRALIASNEFELASPRAARRRSSDVCRAGTPRPPPTWWPRTPRAGPAAGGDAASTGRPSRSGPETSGHPCATPRSRSTEPPPTTSHRRPPRASALSGLASWARR